MKNEKKYIKKQITLRMPNDLYEALLEIKNIKKISIPQLIISVVWKGIKEFSFIFQDWFYRVLFQIDLYVVLEVALFLY